MVHEPSLSSVTLSAVSLNNRGPSHDSLRQDSPNAFREFPRTSAICHRIDFDDHGESADLQNGLIACSCNSDYSVRGICAAFDFRGDSNSIARQQLLQSGALNHCTVTGCRAMSLQRMTCMSPSFQGASCEEKQC